MLMVRPGQAEFSQSQLLSACPEIGSWVGSSVVQEHPHSGQSAKKPMAVTSGLNPFQGQREHAKVHRAVVSAFVASEIVSITTPCTDQGERQAEG